MSEFTNRIRKPLAVTGAALAGLAFNGCGGGDKDFNFRVLCEQNEELRVVSTKQPTIYGNGSSVAIACEDQEGQRSAPRSIQLANLGGDAILANYNLTVTVDEEGDAVLHGTTTAAFDVAPRPTENTTIRFGSVDQIKQVAVSPIASPTN